MNERNDRIVFSSGKEEIYHNREGESVERGRISLFRDEEASDLVRSQAFQQSWRQLAARTPGFTRLQEPEFLITWYRLYKDNYQPVLIAGYGDHEKLVGLICLAWDRREENLVHAGNAEYHGWLALPEAEGAFIRAAFQLVREKFPLKKWSWHWMPPGFSIRPLQAHLPPDVRLLWERQDSPVWDLTEPDKLNKMLKSRSLKSKFNRYKRRGELRFEVATKPDQVERMLNIARYQCDFRREAFNNVRPFEDDPHKIAFGSELQRFPGVLHVSGLWLDDQLLACHMGVADGRQLCLGMISHDPSESKQSPGTLLLIELAKHLAENGFQIFDLTPGTDSYKDRYANDSQLLYKPAFYFSRSAYYRDRLKKAIVGVAKKTLQAANISPSQWRKWKTNLQEVPAKMSQLLRRKGLPVALFRKKSRILYVIELKERSATGTFWSPPRMQQYQDLIFYQDRAPFLTRRALLLEADQKFSDKEILYSEVRDGKLIWAAWKQESPEKMKFNDGSEELELPEDAVLIYDFYYHSSMEDQSLFYQNLRAVVEEVRRSGVAKMLLCLDGATPLSDEKIRGWNISVASTIRLKG